MADETPSLKNQFYAGATPTGLRLGDGVTPVHLLSEISGGGFAEPPDDSWGYLRYHGRWGRMFAVVDIDQP